ncbi:MAG TPA: dual specificity protein phosphatase family protein [Acidobacteriota bacterium]|nr:dual specificity protein phosphatase family protein [Acidobacteriota bacterium]
MIMGILKYTKTVLFFLLLLIPYFSWSEESVDGHAESWGQIQHEKVSAEIPKKNWSSIKVKNFGRIDEQYFRGAQPKNHDYEDLAALGIKTVITLTNSDTDPNEKVMVENAGMKYYQIPMDSHTPPADSQLAEFLRLVNDPESYPVYVHCAAGKHRTGVMTAIYRMTKYRWTADQAYKEMKKYKFGLSFFHPKLKKYIYDYYRELTRASRTPSSQAPN